MVFRLVLVLALVAHAVAIPAPQATPAPSAARAFNGIPIPGIGTLLGVDTAISTGTTTVGGKACPTFTGGGTLYLINSTNVLGLGDATNHVDGHFDLTCKVLSNGDVVPDLKLYGGQDEHEHLTIPGVLTFSDGTGTISSVQGMDQGYVSVDSLSGASG
ncbi:hypothetical protein FA10DRAFT_277413 [Acaromyces ingoldii]|uniref:Uncharacterized protein n=1 Tax=Acaromyces ingoldii TaxID=215250 RepID=A0A316YYD8_9BASI|nr:hypothetical protein FA10DRAFT_277413 [Acaromyces ingoldii]PWN93648.1 hypothetical protein FA10DRAFT_277413 [Acaromyces ingoldii]